MTKLNVAGSIDSDAKIHAQFDDLYQRGQGYDFFAVVRCHISDHGKNDAGPKLTIKLDAVERAIDDTDQKRVRQLMADLIDSRGGDQQLEFPKSAVEALTADLEDHMRAKKMSKAKVQQAWVTYFRGSNGDESPIPAGPWGAEEIPLREFCLEIGAIDDNPAKDTKTDDSTNDDPE